jgi:hypothetical protein
MSCASLSSVSPTAVYDDGGETITLTGTFDPTAVYAVSIVTTDDGEIHCYSGSSGSGTLATPLSSTQLQAVVPPLPRGGPYAIRVRDATGAVAAGDLTAALTSRNRIFHERVPTLRQLMPPSFATGPRNLGVTDALALVDVSETNSPATFDAIPDQEVGVDAAFSYTPTGYSDPDGPGPVTWFAINLPSWATVNPSTGEITGTAPSTASVFTNACIGVNDGQLVTASNAFTLTVLDLAYPAATNFWTFDDADITTSPDTATDVIGGATLSATFSSTGNTTINGQGCGIANFCTVPTGTFDGDSNGDFTFACYVDNTNTVSSVTDPFAGNTYPNDAATDTGWYLKTDGSFNSRYTFNTYANGHFDSLLETIGINHKGDGQTHIVITFKSSTGEKAIYINGRNHGSKVVTQYIGQDLSSAAQGWIARPPGGPNGFNSTAIWDEMHFWDGVALTEEEVQAFYAERALATSYPAPSNYWSFDDADISGSTLVDQIGVLDGTLVNTPTTSQAGIIPGEAVYFDSAQNEYVDFGVGPFDFTGSFSVAMWIYRVGGNTLRRFIQNRGTGTLGAQNGWMLRWESSGLIEFHLDNGPTALTVTAPSDGFDWITFANRWWWIGATFDSTTGTAKVFWNGQTLGQGTAAGLIGANLTSGRNSTMFASLVGTTVSQDFDGRGDEAAVWNGTCLTDAEMRAVHLQGSKGLRLDAP